MVNPTNNELNDYERYVLIPALANRCYHIPPPPSENDHNNHNNHSSSWFSDLIQYFRNTHPLLSIICYHRLHPIKYRLRILNLFGSFMLGLSLTNCVWLWYYYRDDNYNDGGDDDPIIKVGVKTDWDSALDLYESTYRHSNGTSSTTFGQEVGASEVAMNQVPYNEISINQAMILLWTVGCMFHTLYDYSVWYLEACVCCFRQQKQLELNRYGGTSTKKSSPYDPQQRTRLQVIGTYLVMFFIVVLTVFATSVILLRVRCNQNLAAEIANSNNSTNNNTQNDENTNHDLYNVSTTILNQATRTASDILMKQRRENLAQYNFVKSYCIELILSMCFYYPLFTIILFSGCLGCNGTIPMLGGRMYEIKQLERKKIYEERKNANKMKNNKPSFHLMNQL